METRGKADSRGAHDTPAEERPPGGAVPLKEKVCGIHCYAHDPSRQVVAHHFCSHVSGEMRQCVIYDSNKSDARLIGIEYIVSRRIFETLPPEERQYWHSHEYEVKSGMLVAPGIPTILETEEMQSLADTYGKTWHLWQVDRGDTLPLGPAQLMGSFTADKQVNEDLLASTHKKFGYDTGAIREAREKIEYPNSLPEGCDAFWTGGKTLHTEIVAREASMRTS